MPAGSRRRVFSNWGLSTGANWDVTTISPNRSMKHGAGGSTEALLLADSDLGGILWFPRLRMQAASWALGASR
jgi:hypothetical protein